MVHTIAQMYRERTSQYPELDVQMEKDKKGIFISKTYRTLESEVFALAVALKTLNIKRQQLIGIISDNCGKWLLTDLALQFLGAVDVPRGSEATDNELVQILKDVKTEICFVQNEKFLKKILSLKSQIKSLKIIIVMENCQFDNSDGTINIYSFDSLLEMGKEMIKTDSSAKDSIIAEVEKGTSDELCTIIFTSGTTGDCKGVMLTQDNMIFEVERVGLFIKKDLKPGQRWLSVLPIWHSFERAVNYTALYNANSICYSKPIGRIMFDDLQKVNPHWFPSVPRIWQVIYQGIAKKISNESGLKKMMGNFFVGNAKKYQKGNNKVKGLLPRYKNSTPRLLEYLSGIPSVLLRYPMYRLGQKLVFKNVKKTLGPNFISGISGGGSMPKGVDVFFNAIGIQLLDGYGMTETSPIIGVRDSTKPVLGVVNICQDTEIKIVDEFDNVVEKGAKGILKVRGRQVMRGYYNNEEATRKVLSADGWMNTGDLVIESNRGYLSIVGRAKDTIVLAGGENLEPLPIEEKLSEVELIASAIVIGQDRKYISALIVPNMAAIKEYILTLHDNIQLDLDKEAIYKLIQDKINEKINIKFGFKPHELINKFILLDKPFEMGLELSAKQELKRFEIEKIYNKEINSFYAL
ncbi:MAG: AMP-binding protein [Spirochaetaceae bacterium]|nr:AMP-binding protein [Spirochaetaceae bacterium]